MSDETETLVHLYADGELSGDAAQAFEARMAAEPQLAAAVAAVVAQSARIRAELPDPSPEHLSRLMSGARTRRTAAPRRIAAALALMALGAVGGFAAAQSFGADGAGTALAESAAGAHALYSVEVLHPVEVTASERDHLAGWLSNRLGAEISAPDLVALGYDLVGGRLLPFQGRGAAQFMYQTEDGERVTLFAVTADRPTQSSFRFRDEGGTTAVTWQEGLWRFALVGDVPRADLERAARHIYDDRI